MAKKDAMGQEVDSLYLSLGLDAADLEMGFQTAGQTVRQAMSRLNSEANQIRLKADIDVTRLEAAGKSVDALKTREKALNDELAVQQKKLELLNRAYESNAKTYGADHALTRGVDTKRLYQTRDIERLKAQLAAVNAELKATSVASTGAFGKLSAGAQRATGAVKGVTASIASVNAKIAGISAAAAGGYGLFSLTDNAMKAGNDLYKLSTRLHTTTAEASKLTKVFKLSGVDINSVVPLFARLDKQALATGKSENTMAQAMREFGFSLTDNGGNLLSYEQQLEQLSKGYMKAVQSGKEAEFVANVLGGRGAALVPLLQDYATNMEIISRVKTTGLLNPKEAHELYIEWQAMQMQAGQLTGAIGQALLPVAHDLMPETTRGFAELAKLIADNKDSIKEFGSAAGTALGGMASAMVSLVSILGEVKKGFDDITGSSSNTLEVLRRNGFGGYLNQGKTAGAVLGGLVGGAYGGPAGAVGGAAVGSNVGEGIYGRMASALMSEEEAAAIKKREELRAQEKAAFEDYNKQIADLKKGTVQSGIEQEQKAAEIQKALEHELSEATSDRLKEQLQAIKEKVEASIAEGKDEAAAWISAADDIKKAMKAAAKEAQEANKALTRSINSLSMSDLGKSLYGVDTAAEDTLKKGADPALVAREAALKKSKIYEQFEKETAEYLDGIYADSLTKRLNQIEREKKAWIKKGMDEVTATRAAETQKQQAVNDSVKNMFTSQKKYLEIYRQAMRGQVMGNNGMYDFTQAQGNRQQNAINAMRAAMMRDAGVNPGEHTSMAEVLGFQKAMKEANNWGASLLGGDTGGLSELTSAISQSNSEVTNILGQISPEVSQVNSTLSSILGAVQQEAGRSPQITVSPTINVDLGGAYVFDNAMKQTLTDDITRNVAGAVTDAVQSATSRINTSYGS